MLPLCVIILIALFIVQRHGTATMGRFFGPIMMAWFGTLALVGVYQVAQAPAILEALNPVHAFEFLHARGWHLFLAMGAIVLSLTGAEALYADLGHFGKLPVRMAWTGFVLPALALNYLGQGALLISDPKAAENPFCLMFPSMLLLPAVLLATVATVIASQAVISGAYSMTKQAIQLGFLPRMHIEYTSAREIGQIYIPMVNWMLLGAVLLATVGFGSSSAMAAAYGIAVTMTMMISTTLTFFVVYYGWKYPLPLVIVSTCFFLTLDAVLVTSCLLKFLHGGWFPIVLGAGIFAIMSTWKRGRQLLIEHIRRDDPKLEPFIEALRGESIPIVPRTAVFLVANADTVPQALLHNIKHNMVLHECNVMLTVVFREVPWVPFSERVSVDPIARGVWRVIVNYGFKNVPDVPQALELCAQRGLEVNLYETSYFISRETVIPTPDGGMAWWREQLFAAMSRNAGSVVEFFRIPSNSVIELGTRIQI